MKLIYTLLALSIILASCGTSNTVTSNHFLQKRKYTSGWYFNHSTSVGSSYEKSINETANIQSSVSSIIKVNETIKLDDIDTIETNVCDSIVLMDRKIVRAYILSETDTTILYSKCDSDDPSEFTMDKKNIKAIQYANGKFEILQKTPSAVAQKIKKKQVHPALYRLFAFLFLMTCFGLFIAGSISAISPGLFLVLLLISATLFLVFLIASRR